MTDSMAFLSSRERESNSPKSESALKNEQTLQQNNRSGLSVPNNDDDDKKLTYLEPFNAFIP